MTTPAQATGVAAGWAPQTRTAMMDYLSAEARRRIIKTSYTDAADLAAALDPRYRVTPALKLIARSIETVLTEPRRNLLVTCPPQEGKLIHASTEVPTPGGWRKHGELANGDVVFHPSGKPIRVVAKHPDDVVDRRVYFSDHTFIDVHRFHEWTVFDRSPRTWRTIETADMERHKLDTGQPGKRGHRYRFQLPLREAIELPDAELPIDPYTLGVWLGDGSSRKAAVTHHPADAYELPYPHSARFVHSGTGVITDYYRSGLCTALRTAGVFANKHIPAAYLRGSIAQRRALLAGLIDTDGCVYGTQTSFDNANEQLVRDTAELIRSLGYRSHVHRPTQAKTSSSGVVGVQDMWRVTFSPHDVAPSRLPRKVAKWRPAIRRRVAITHIEKLDTPGIGNCITIDSDDGLYLVGEGWTPTHNSTLCAVYTPLRALMLNPNCRIILATHGDHLAEESSRLCQSLINSHGAGVVDPLTGVAVEDKLGYRIAQGSARVKSWKLRGSRGGMLAVGWGSSIVGRPAELMIIDDVFKNMMEADSLNHRRKIAEWFSSVALTRLSPDASIIHISTRWHPEDLAGMIMATEQAAEERYKTWRHINIPAIAEDGIPDALNRAPGVVMESARGRTKAEFEATRRAVGERTWYAMYEGVPAPPEGGLFQRDWFDPPADPPTNPVAAIVAVDPADSGKDGNDDSGIIGGVLNPDGTVVFTEDWSGLFTAQEWGRRAVVLALTISAREIAFEAYTSSTTYARVIKDAYRAIHLDALVKQRGGVDLTPVEFRALGETPPFTTFKWRGGARIDAVGRSAYLRQGLETRQVRVVPDKLDQLVEDAAGWQPGQHQPDRLAAAVICHDRLARLGSGRMDIGMPINERGDPVTRLRVVDGPQGRLARRLGH